MKSAAIRLLYIDDESGIREMTRRELGRQGIDVSIASDGEEGLDLFRKSPFPIVASDLKMPGMDGLQVLRAIKAIDSDTEVLMATGFGSQDDAIACLKAGACDYIYKPFSMTEFLVLIRRASERRSLKAQVALSECIQSMSVSLELDAVLEMFAEGLRRALQADDVSLEIERDGDPAADPVDSIAASLPVEHEDSVDGVRRSSLIVFLRGREGFLRTLVVRRRGSSPSFSESDKRTLFLFATQAAIAIENARLHQALQKQNAELQETREQLIHLEKLSTLGRLTAGVAHELNNPLTGILGQAQLLLLKMPPEAPYRNDIAFVESEAQRCRVIVQNLLHFSRRQKMDWKPVDLCKVVDEALIFVRKIFALKGIRIEERYEEDLPPVQASTVHLIQVLLNLFENALDATEAGGILRIQAARRDGTVRLTVTDSGSGIVPDVLPHIFEPFFTTKDIGKGTGLGLAISQGIVQSHKGALEVQSPPPGEIRGTEFALVLPVAEESHVHEPYGH